MGTSEDGEEGGGGAGEPGASAAFAGAGEGGGGEGGGGGGGGHRVLVFAQLKSVLDLVERTVMPTLKGVSVRREGERGRDGGVVLPKMGG